MKIILKNTVTYVGEFDTDDVLIAKMAAEACFADGEMTEQSNEIETYTVSENTNDVASEIVHALPELAMLSGQALQQAKDIISDIINRNK